MTNTKCAFLQMQKEIGVGEAKTCQHSCKPNETNKQISKKVCLPRYLFLKNTEQMLFALLSSFIWYISDTNTHVYIRSISSKGFWLAKK